MENKQYPPRGGPPLVYRCRGIPYAFNADRSGDAVPEFAGTDRFQEEAARADLSACATPDNVGRDSCCQNFRIEEDVGPPGRFQVPILAGWRNLHDLKHPVGTRERFAQKIPEEWREAGSWKPLWLSGENRSLKPVSDLLFPSSNADRSRDAVPDFTGTGRFRNDSEEADADLSASIRPDNVGQTEKGIMEHRIRLPGLLAGKNTRHVGKSRDKSLVVYKPIGKMSERVGDTGPPPGRTDPNARENARQAWKCSSGGGEYPLREREHPFGDKKHPFGDWKYPFGDRNDSFGDKKHPFGERKHPLGDRNDSLGDWNDSLGNRNNSLGDWNDSLWYGNDPVKNWMDTGPPGGLPVSVWMPNPENWGVRDLVCGSKNDVLTRRKGKSMRKNDIVTGRNGIIRSRNDKAAGRNGILMSRNDRLTGENDELTCRKDKSWYRNVLSPGQNVFRNGSLWIPNLEGLIARAKARDPAGQPPATICRSGTRRKTASVWQITRLKRINAVRSNDADRLEEVATADLSACKAPDNVEITSDNVERIEKRTKQTLKRNE